MYIDTPQVVDKTWGHEVWLDNTPDYCGKLLVIEPGKSGSLHRHRWKRESFFALKGVVQVEWWPDGLEGAKRYEALRGWANNGVRLDAGVWHRFWVHEDAGTDGVLMEVSTTHDDEDVERCYDWGE
jgi:mannose-6-phosphate isomerase-like protein (cupin superfamily)